MELYKYVASDRIDILQNGLIRFTQAKALNDPFDAQPYVRKIFSQEYLSRLMPGFDFPEQVLNAFDAQFIPSISHFLDEEIGILSLTQIHNSILMWSHYAQDHQGFVLHFENSHSFFLKSAVSSSRGFRFGAVQYSDKRPEIVFSDIDFKTVLPGLLKSPDSPLPIGLSKVFSDKEKVTRIIGGIFFTKSKAWEYEQEWRFVRPLIDCTQKISNPEGDIYLYAIPPQAITGITFGCRMSAERKREICHFIKENQRFSHLQIFEAIPDEKEFKLNARPYKDS